MNTNQKQLFLLGQVVSTKGALALLEEAGRTPAEFLSLHQSGDWGDLCEEDKQMNDDAIQGGDRIFSSYKINGEEKIWIITEHDRSVTTLLLSDEY